MPASESSSSSWNREQDVQFERALATYPEDLCDRWEKIAAGVTGKSLEEVKYHYELLVDDVNRIESGFIQVPCYNSSSDGSSSYGGDEGIGKKSGNLGLLNSDSNHGSKSSRSDQERRKGIAWTEDEHSVQNWVEKKLITVNGAGVMITVEDVEIYLELANNERRVCV